MYKNKDENINISSAAQSELQSICSVVKAMKTKREREAMHNLKENHETFKKVYVYRRITDRQTDKTMYRFDKHLMSQDSCCISSIAVEKITFPPQRYGLTDLLTYEQTDNVDYRVASLLIKALPFLFNFYYLCVLISFNCFYFVNSSFYS